MTDELEFTSVDQVIAKAMRTWRPPPRLTLSEWADRYFYLSSESSSQPGRWKAIPYQRGILDAITDPAIEHVTLMKSARVGYTLCLSAAIAYYMHQDPSSILVVQPTVDDAKGFSKEVVAPMLRDVPVLAAIVFEDIEEKGPKVASNTLTHKAFPGGVLSLVGANSGAGLRRITRRIVALDEVDAYPPSAGTEGDPVRLAVMRTQTYWNRKIVDGSTPLIAGSSRIAELFELGDRRRYYVPCPHCGHMDFLAFRESDRGGHWMAWPEGEPEKAHFVCSKNGCVIEHHHKREMVERGEWRAEGECRGHASFHIWAAYSYSANATWGHIAKEFVESNKAGPEQLKTFVNTWLGETWTERGEAPDWMRLYQQREAYEIGTVPAGVLFLTAGVDVMHDHLVYEVVGWGADRQSWSIDAGIVPGDTAREEPWLQLDQLLGATWPGADGVSHTIRMLAVDSGDQTQTVYSWARGHSRDRVIATKGVKSEKGIIGAPSAVDVTIRGKKMRGGYKVWPVGVDHAKRELYGWLRLEPVVDGASAPPGFCHFPEHGEEYFKQLTSEQLVQVRKRTGHVTYEWQVIPGRKNHWLDCRVLARAAAALVGLDKQAARRRPAPPPAAATMPHQAREPERKQEQPKVQEQQQRPPPPQRREGGWLSSGRGRGLMGSRGNWLNPRR